MRFLVIALFLTLPQAPFGVQWGIKHDKIPEVENYRYWYGDMEWGETIHLGTSDIAGMTSELQLYYVSKKLSSAILVLGPAGINEFNCMRKYKEIVNSLNEKYGHYRFQRALKDPMIDDLIAVGACHPVLVGLYEVETIWKTGDFNIIAALFGDEEEIFIEINYIYLSLRGKEILQNKKRVTERL